MWTEKVVGWVLGAAVLVAGGCDAEGRPDTAWQRLEDGERTHGQFFIGDEIEDIEYQVVDGLAMHQGDIVLGAVDELSPWELGEDIVFSATSPNNRWPGGVVPYAIDSGIEDGSRDVFLEALGELHSQSNVLWVERTDEKNYVFVTSDPDRGCSAVLGFTDSGAQSLNLASGCQHKGIALHEIGHSLGLFHEQSRADRDDHISISWANIKDGKAHNFASYEKSGAGEDVGPYDFDSIMHYRPTAFAIVTKSGQTTSITAKDGRTDFGQREGYSKGDVGGLARLYGPRDEPAECSIALRPGEFMRSGDKRTSCNGRFSIEFRDDGNLVLFDGAKAIGQTATAGAAVGMFLDGSFGVVTESYGGLWIVASGQPQAYVVLQDDGPLVVRSPTGETLWTSMPG